MKERLKRVLYFLLYYSGLEAVLARLLRVDAAAVLMYHGVCRDTRMPGTINFHLDGAAFERQARFLARRYRVIPLNELLDRMARGERLNKQIVLTFDDGYRNNATEVAPILARHGLPFTIFAATRYVGEQERWIPLNELYALWAAGKISRGELDELRRKIRGGTMAGALALVAPYRERLDAGLREWAGGCFAMLSRAEVERLAAAGVDFGSHTHTHCNLRREEPAAQQDELATSRRILEECTGRAVRSFAYPYGHAEHYSAETRSRIEACGYDCAITADYGVVSSTTDRFAMPRLGYDTRLYFFAGELLYQFARRWVKQGR